MPDHISKYALSTQDMPEDPENIRINVYPNQRILKEYAKKMASLYGSRVRYFQYWNEPNNVINWIASKVAAGRRRRRR